MPETCDACGGADSQPRACGHQLCAECFIFGPFRVVDGHEIQCPVCLGPARGVGLGTSDLDLGGLALADG